MGKSGGRKKKSGGTNPPSSATTNHHPPPSPLSTPAAAPLSSGSAPPPPPPLVANGGGAVVPDPSLFLKRAQELKEEGNRRFQAKDYAGALEQYDLAIKLTPRSHPDRAVFHSNRAACLMQMRPVDHHAAASECSLALQAQPGFPRALIRRARALEALGKHELALMDVQSVLASDPAHRDALEIAKRLKTVLGRQEPGAQQQDLPSRPSPAALGASAVRGAPIAGIGPCLPSRPVPKKPSPAPPSGKPEKPTVLSDTQQHLPNGTHPMSQPKGVSLKPFKSASAPSPPSSSSSISLEPASTMNSPQNSGQPTPVPRRRSAADLAPVVRQRRPLKLVYDHDIRLAEMPAKCNFKALREIVTKRFPSSKSVLIKYKDADDDLVTITCTAELRLAESYIDQLALKDGKEEEMSDNALKMLRLHVVEVSLEQEPELFDEVEEEEKAVEDDGLVKGDESMSNSSNGESPSKSVDNGFAKTIPVEEVTEEKKTEDKECNHAECKDVETDDWLFEFAQLFRTHVGIDPDAHLDFHELGMELCSEALEETVTSEEAQNLFEMAASKFQEVAALAFFNWGNVHMCAARKRIPLDESAPKEVMSTQLQSAYDWVKERYELAGQKYEESLRIKPDFYEGLLALGQQHFENAKLQWSFAVANKVDLKTWDSSETIQLFNSAEEKMKAATEMWEKFEEQRPNELKDPGTSKKDELSKRKKKQGSSVDGHAGELSPTEAAEQAAVMHSQIHLFWGNMLFERSQVEFKLGSGGWKNNLDAAVERFKLAGASEADIALVMKNHASSEVGSESDEKKVTDLIDISEMVINNEDKHVLES